MSKYTRCVIVIYVPVFKFLFGRVWNLFSDTKSRDAIRIVFEMSLSYILISLLTVLENVSCSSYIRLDSVNANGTIPVEKYRTSKTGIQINIAKTNRPLVNGYLTFATEARDDNGLPHTLEHLIFMGSEDYPYKGALDLIANRLNSDGTNAWTATDHTAYTTSHAGKDGLLNLLPIFMDHLLYPTLTPYAFKTEVYHTNGEGLDGGVVYSEMQGADSLNDRLYDKLMKGMYRNNGYSSYTGGALKNLRENTTNELVIAYHKQMYRPENLCITVCGDVTIDEIMKSMKKVENKIKSKPRLLKFVKPWQTPVPSLRTTIVKILYPSNEDGLAEIYVGWRGPNCVTEFRAIVACSVLLEYLCSSSISPVKRYFTEKESLASDISTSIYENAASTLIIEFDKVPTEKVDLVYPRLQNLLKKIAKGCEKFDIERIKNIISSKMLTYLSNLEKSPHQTIARLLIKEFLHGESADDFHKVLNIQEQLEYLLTVPASYWTNLINKYFVDKKYAEAIGIYSEAEISRAAKEESDRIAKRKTNLGPYGLKKKADELANAIKFNSRPLPKGILKSVAIPNTNFEYFDLKIYRTGTSEHPSGLDLKSWPMYAEAYDCRTNFVSMTATLFTDGVEATLRPYLQLFFKLIVESPIQYGDILTTYENVISRIQVDAIDVSARLGLDDPGNIFSCGSYSQTATFTLVVEKNKYERGANLLIDLLRNTVFVVERIKLVGKKLLSTISESMDNGSSAMDLLKTMYYKLNSNVKANSMMYQKKFLTSLLTKLDSIASQEVIDDLNKLRNFLLTPSNLAVHVTADWSAVNKLNIDLNAPWKQGFKSGTKKLNILPDWKIMIAPKTVSAQGEVVGLTSTESYFLNHASPSLNDFNHDDVAALSVALKYLTQIEGPMWRRLRGPGFTYGYKLYLSINEGLIHFSLIFASDLIKAFDESVNIINEVLQPDAVWEQTLLDSAKGAAIFEVVNRVPTLGDLPLQSLIASYRQVSADYNQKLVQKITEVQIDDLKRVAQLYMTKIFSTTESKTVVVCNIAEAERISVGLKKYGLNLPARQSWDTSLLAQF